MAADYMETEYGLTREEADCAIARIKAETKRAKAHGALFPFSPPPIASPDEILTEALRRDAAMEVRQVKPLSEEAFWAAVRRARR